MVGRANPDPGLFRRNISFCNRRVMEAAFMGPVRPMLEYAGVVWDPYTANLCSEIEKVQRRAVRFVTSDYHNFESGTLKQRRTASTLIYFNQVLHSLSALSIDNLPAPTRKTRYMHTILNISWSILHVRMHSNLASYHVPTLPGTVYHSS